MHDETPPEPDGSPFIGPSTPMMADVLSRIDRLDITPTRRRDMQSDIRSLCRIIDKLPEAVPANINWVHVRLRRIHPIQVGISKKRFQNIKSNVLKALEMCGCSRKRSDWLRASLPAWQVLLDSVPDRHDRWKLTQLAQYCSALGVEPDALTSHHLTGLLAALEQETFVDKPAAKVSTMAAVWNRLRATIAVWPQITLDTPRKKEPWTISLDRFPASFQDDVARWLDRLANPDPMDADGPLKPLRESTIKHRRFQIQEMASALIHSGHSIHEITSLSFLVDLDNFKTGLRYIMGRFGDKPTEAIHGLAMGLKAIATHHVRVEEDHLGQLRRICQRLNLEVDGLREKNRRRLEQLYDDINLARLLHLPAKLVRQSMRPGLRPQIAALKLQAALAIEILLYAPMRIGNLAALSLERHIRRVTAKREQRIIISIPGNEVKNRKDLNFELSAATAELFDGYLKNARPILVRAPSEYLFPAQDGGYRAPHTLSALIKKTILEHTGLEINAHLFRSIAGKIHSMVQPGDFVTLSHVIGDTLKTAMKAYAQFEQKNAIRHYQRSVDEARSQLMDAA